MTTRPTLTVAIVGSGPSGCYLAQALLRAVPGSELTIFDRLVSPFGLIRYGVAADHQHTKAISRQFDRLFQSGDVRFAGDIEVGRDLSIAELREHFDVVVFATGLSADRKLGIPGADLPGVYGSGELIRILNAHPDEPEELPKLGSDIVLIGAGNVALDILRFLVKSRDHYDASDVADTALECYLEAPAERVTLASRSTAAQSKGDPQMFMELAKLPRASYVTPDPLSVDDEADRVTAKRVAALSELVSDSRDAFPGPAVTLRFGVTPLRVLGDTRVEAVEFASASGSVTVPATSIITAIGFDLLEGLAPETLVGLAATGDTGRIEPGLYRAGWAKRGPRGGIPDNRACAKGVAAEIAEDLASGTTVPSAERRGFAGLPDDVRERAISYEQWLTLDAHECELATNGRVRRKIPDHTQMAAIARGAAEAHTLVLERNAP